MCGISGIINKSERAVESESIKKITALIAHRGPDDEGFYLENNFAFGHRRLAILDLSSDAHQPMHYLDRYVITYNGEIYNYIEIKESLEKENYHFTSNSDTEVILASYDKWGDSCVNKFNGMWAFSIYDKLKNTIFCSRDRFGIKPFYYTSLADKFVFGSEIKQLLEFYDDNYVNERVLMDYLVIGFENHTKESFFDGIVLLEASHNLVYDLTTHTYSIKKYFDINQDASLNQLNEQESISHYSKKFYNAIRLRLRSDVKVGTCLSGGLDSSSIASVASSLYQKNSSEKFVAIHAKSSQKSSDESLFAQEVANHCNLDINIITPSIEDFVGSIDEVIYTQEEPFGSTSIFMQYFVMKKAKELGCKVMLDGQGGDETLLGYERYYPAYLLSLGFFDKFSGLVNSSKNSKLSIKKLLEYTMYFTRANFRVKRLHKKSSYIKEQYLKKISTNVIEDSARNYLNIFKLQYGEIYTTQLPHLLRYEDKNSMRHSVETRLPFIDYELLGDAISLKQAYKIKNGWSKYILRKVVDTLLPKTVVWRKNKFGFESPSKSWLDSIEDEMKKSIENSTIIKKISKNIDFNTLDDIQKWKLYNVAKWELIYDVKLKEKS